MRDDCFGGSKGLQFLTKIAWANFTPIFKKLFSLKRDKKLAVQKHDLNAQTKKNRAKIK